MFYMLFNIGKKFWYLHHLFYNVRINKPIGCAAFSDCWLLNNETISWKAKRHKYGEFNCKYKKNNVRN